MGNIHAALVCEGHKSSTGAAWGAAQSDGRVIIRALVEHGIPVVTAGEAKFEQYVAQRLARADSSKDLAKEQRAPNNSHCAPP